MLLDYKICKSKQHELEGALHIDETARIQTINSLEENPFMYALLSHLDEAYNVKALINTSFNAAGEPIVHTIEDAEKSAINMNLDAIVINGVLKNLN
jgi:carbamoyltransferase